MTVQNPVTGIQSHTDISALADRRDRVFAWQHTTAGMLVGGVIPGFGNELAVTVGAGLSVNVDSGAALLPAPQATHGGWPCVNDAILNLTLAARHATSPRIDLIIARVADAFYYSGGDGLAAIEIVTGTPSVSPLPPAVPTAKGSYLVIGWATVPSSAAGTAVTISKNTIADVPRAKLAGAGQESWSPAGISGTTTWNNVNQRGVRSRTGGWASATGFTQLGDNGPAASTPMLTYVTLPYTPASVVADGDLVGRWRYETSVGAGLNSGDLLFDAATGTARLRRSVPVSDGAGGVLEELPTSNLYTLRLTYRYPA